MNPFYEELPCAVEIDMESYPIITDYREWIRFIALVKDVSIGNREKQMIMLDWYLGQVPNDIPKAFFALCDFLEMKNIEDSSGGGKVKKEKATYSYQIDAPYIIAGFQECYGIDLLSVKYMHWWRFQMLFRGLNSETEIMKRISYRSINLGDIKDKAERSRIRKIQERIALPQEVISDYDIGNAFV